MIPYTDADAPPADIYPPDDQPTVEPQNDFTAEQSVLGGMMLDPKVIDDVLAELVPADFYRVKHELIAKAIFDLYNRNDAVDPITVGDELRRTEQLEKAGGAAYLHELTSIVPTASNAGFYARIIHEQAVKRRLVFAGHRILGFGNASEGDVADLVEQARAELDRVEVGHRNRTLAPIGENLSELIEFLDHKPQFLATPWEALNKLIGGFARGALYVIAARPGQGKSIAALQCAVALAEAGTVALSSVEMTEQELQVRLVSNFGGIHMTTLRNHSLGEDDWRRLAAAQTKVQATRIFVDDDAGASMGSIRSHARTIARTGSLSGIVIDYLQLVQGEGRDRREIVDELSRQAKRLAKDMNVPVVAAAQLKRAGVRKGLPGLDDLREAGGIEQNADVVLLLDRDKDKTPNEITVVVAKNRHGDVGKFTLVWEAKFARLRDKPWSPTLGIFHNGFGETDG